LIDKSAGAAHARIHLVNSFSLRPVGMCLQIIDLDLEGRERCSEFVGGIGDESPLLIKGLLMSPD